MSVNSYLLQMVNYAGCFANFSGKSTACLVRARTLAPSGVVDGIKIRVILEPAVHSIITAFPIK